MTEISKKEFCALPPKHQANLMGVALFETIAAEYFLQVDKLVDAGFEKGDAMLGVSFYRHPLLGMIARRENPGWMEKIEKVLDTPETL